MGPIAKRLAKHLKRGGDAKALGQWCRRPEAAGDRSALPPEQSGWLRDFATVMSLAYELLNRGPLAEFKGRFEAWDQEYMPGAPPMSPILDSFFMSWQACDVDLGEGETFASIAANLAPLLGLQKLQSHMRTLAGSYRGVFVVRGEREGLVELEELIVGKRYTVCIGDPVPASPGTVWWTRLLPPKAEADDWTVLGTPYLLTGARAWEDWSEYLGRVLADVPAERRKPAYIEHMKWGPAATFWLDYVMDGYSAPGDVAVSLTGVPDRPETLPHADGDPGSMLGDPDQPVFQRLRERLLVEASRNGALEAAVDDVAAFCGGEENIPLDPAGNLHPLVYAFATMGIIDDQGDTGLSVVRKHARLAPDEAELADALLAGGFSVFEVLEVEIDVRLEVRDILRRRRFWISERAATRGVSPGDLVAGWVAVQGDETKFEGALAHVPRLWAEPFRAAVRGARDLFKAQYPKLSSSARQGLLVPAVLASLRQVKGMPPNLELQTHDGEPLLLGEAHFSMKDPVEVIAHLAVLDLEAVEPKVWHRISAEGVIESRIELSGSRLVARARSRAGLERVKAWLQAQLGGLIQHRADSFEDMLSDAAASEPAPPVGPLPPQIQAALRKMLEEHTRAWVDEPVPALDGKTPRQAARSKKGKNQVTALLLEQERLLADHPQLDGPLDMRPVWAELGLTHPDNAP